MNSLSRVIPFLWPSRRKLAISVIFAVLVAILWGGNLSVVFPVVKVLMQGQSLHDYVQQQIVATEKELTDLDQRLQSYEGQFKTANETEAVHLLSREARTKYKLTDASQRLAGWHWLMLYVIPLVPRDQFNTFAVIAGLLLVMTMVKLFCIFIEEVLVGEVVQLTIMRIREQFFRKVLALDYQTLSLEGTPQLMSRFTNDMETLSNGLSLLGGKVVREPLKAFACIGFAFWVNWRLSLLSMLFVPLALFVFNRIGRVLKKASHRTLESMSRIYKVLEEAFDAMKIVIAFDGGRRHRLHHHLENKTYLEKSVRIVRIDALTSPVTELFGTVALSIAMLPGSYLVLRQTTSIWGFRLSFTQMDVAELSVLYAMLAGVIDPVRKLSSVFTKLKRAGAAADRIFSMMDCETLVKEPVVAKPLPKQIKSIDFQEVGFTYASRGLARPPVLDGVTLRVNAGEVLAVVGENGSGKSTLINLLPRYFDPDRGAVLIDGINLRECRLRDLRSRIGIVTQETLLFDDTIYENIRYGRPQATRAEVERAADQAHVTQFLTQLPDGFDTRVGEKGACLSGGQRQRIALARAILRDPSILILDEATSAIDSQSEFLIHKTLETFTRGRTTFIITHSMTQSIRNLVTRILVLERGRLLAVGTHDELLQSCAPYQRLYLVQSQQQTARVAGEDRPAVSSENNAAAPVYGPVPLAAPTSRTVPPNISREVA